jgi:phosphatidylserine decarboxylase
MISQLFGRFAAHQFPKSIQNIINKSYVKLMKIDMSPFEPSQSYPSLNRLFIRALILNRPFDARADIVISPCDALITEAGYIHHGQAHQIKGMSYDTAALLGSEYSEDIQKLEGGAYINLYLSPRDYHRYHIPFELSVHSITHIPGKLFPVNFPLLRRRLNLFTENERVILECSDINEAKHYIVLVGALNVGKMVVTFEPRIKTNSSGIFRQHYEYDTPKQLKKGDLFGWFEMGSTIVMISEKDAMHYDINIGQKVIFGQTIGKIKTSLLHRTIVEKENAE